MKPAQIASFLFIAVMLALTSTGCRRKGQNITPLPGYLSKQVGEDTSATQPISKLPTDPNSGRNGNINTPPPLPPIDPNRTGTPDIKNLPPDPGPVNVTPRQPEISITGAEQPPSDRGNWREDRAIWEQYIVHFDYDKSNIKPGEVSKIEAVAAAFKGMSGKAIRVEGHCDERGTEEYNRSLGERRANSAREFLIRAGVPANLIETQTYGEDKPIDLGHSESAWRKNRRAEFILLSP